MAVQDVEQALTARLSQRQCATKGNGQQSSAQTHQCRAHEMSAAAGARFGAQRAVRTWLGWGLLCQDVRHCRKPSRIGLTRKRWDVLEGRTRLELVSRDSP